MKMTPQQWEATMSHLLKNVPDGYDIVAYLDTPHLKGGVMRSDNASKTCMAALVFITNAMEDAQDKENNQ